MTNVFNKKQIKAIVHDTGEFPDITIVDSSSWVCDNKYQTKEIIVEYQGKFYHVSVSRSGSPFTEYNYEYPEPKDIYPVVKIEYIMEGWVRE